MILLKANYWDRAIKFKTWFSRKTCRILTEKNEKMKLHPPAFWFAKALVMILLSFAVSEVANSQTIPAHRRIDWSMAGAGFHFPTPTLLVNVVDFGAAGNGVNDDYPAIAAAIGALNGQYGTVFFPPGTYLLSNTLVLPDSTTIRGSGAGLTVLKSTVGENKAIISVPGAASSGFINVEAGYSKNSLQLTLASSGIFSKGDVTEMIEDGHLHMTSDWAMNSLGQMLVIDSVNGTNVFLKEPLRMDYAAQLNPRIRKITPRKAVSIECVKIERLTATASQTSNIVFNYAYNCRILGIESNLCNFTHVDVSKSTHITVKDSYFHHGHSYGNGGKAYGIAVQATSGSCLVQNNIFRRLRHSMLLQAGSNGNVFAYNYSFDPYWTEVSLPANSAGDLVLHGNYPYLNLFEGNIVQNVVIDDSHGKNGHHNTFFRNRAELWGFFMNNNPATDSTNFVGNEVTNTGFFMGLYVINGVNHFHYGNNIKGTIQPAGTGNLPDISYYYTQTPDFWNIPASFPPIGPPSTINSKTNPAKARYASGSNFAICPAIQLIITATAEGCGSIDPSGEIPVAYGGNALFTITPDAGCHIAEVIVDGLSVGAVQQYEFSNVASNHTIHAVFSNIPENLQLTGLTFAAFADTCFAARQNITTAGGGSPFFVENGASVELVAGNSILMLPGTRAQTGSHLLARITTNSSWCTYPENLLLAKNDHADFQFAEPRFEPNGNFFRVFPNPTSGAFAVEILDDDQESVVFLEIFNLLGKCILRNELQDQNIYYFCLPEKQPGVYLVRVLKNNNQGSVKLVVQ